MLQLNQTLTHGESAAGIPTNLTMAFIPALAFVQRCHCSIGQARAVAKNWPDSLLIRAGILSVLPVLQFLSASFVLVLFVFVCFCSFLFVFVCLCLVFYTLNECRRA